MTIPSYGKIFNLGHRAVRDIFADEVLIEEKVDGSQFSVWVNPETKELECRSKRCDIPLEDPTHMFYLAVQAFLRLKGRLEPGVIYRGEYLQKPKHNSLTYDRHPTKHVMIFDIDRGNQDYVDYDTKVEMAEQLGLEVVPLLFRGKIEFPEQIKEFLDTESKLGGPKIEGVVIKSYDKFGSDGKALMGKFVSEAFKETNKANFRKQQPGKTDIGIHLGLTYRTEARWQKSVQALRDSGELEQRPQDIGKLVRLVQKDVFQECEGEIKDYLFSVYWKDLSRKVVAGLPEWYKEQLLEQQFGE